MIIWVVVLQNIEFVFNGSAPTARGGLHIGQTTNGFVQELLFSGIAFGLRELEFK
jgi:hypothetical protein